MNLGKEVIVKSLEYIVVGLFMGGLCLIPRAHKPAAPSCSLEHSCGKTEEDTVALRQFDRDPFKRVASEDTFDIPVVINKRVEQFLDYYQYEAQQSLSTYLKRSTKYIDQMRVILVKHGLPKDLVYLALIESGFNPFAYSRAHAMGPWQFLAGTARIYGLRRNTWIDERRDPIKSTEAAAKYMKDLYEVFDDWYLVLAAYNSGQYRVLKAMREARSGDYWDLDLPAQTEDFVPRFLAAAIIAKNPEKYGFNLEYEEPVDHEVVLVAGQTDLKIAAACMGFDVELLRELNPELRRSFTPPNEKAYPLRIPRGTKERFSLCSEEVAEKDQSEFQPQG